MRLSQEAHCLGLLHHAPNGGGGTEEFSLPTVILMTLELIKCLPSSATTGKFTQEQEQLSAFFFWKTKPWQSSGFCPR